MQQSVIKSIPDCTYEYLDPKSEFHVHNYFIENYKKKSLLKKLKTKVLKKSNKKDKQLFPSKKTFELSSLTNLTFKQLDNKKVIDKPSSPMDSSPNLNNEEVEQSLQLLKLSKRQDKVFVNASVQTADNVHDIIQDINNEDEDDSENVIEDKFSSRIKIITKLSRFNEYDQFKTEPNQSTNYKSNIKNIIQQKYGLSINLKKRFENNVSDTTKRCSNKTKMLNYKTENNSYLNSSRNISTLDSMKLKSSELYYGS